MLPDGFFRMPKIICVENCNEEIEALQIQAGKIRNKVEGALLYMLYSSSFSSMWSSA